MIETVERAPERNRPPDRASRVVGASTGTAEWSVAARRLTRSFDDTEVIHPLDLDVDPGTIVGLIGPSGCGKTTTVRLLTGLLAPTSGDAVIGDTPATELTSSQRSRIGYLPQTPALFPDLSLMENLGFHASMYGLPLRRRRRLDEMLDWVELSGDRSKRVVDASGGMQRRLALAAAFVHDPALVFLDEPTAGIDPILRDKFWARFHEVAARGKSIVVTTQYVGEAGKCDLVGLLSDGELLLLDTPVNLRRAAFSGEVVDVELQRPLDDHDLARLADNDFVVGDVERTGPKGLRVVVEDADRAISDLSAALAALGATPIDVSEHIVDYDEAFVRVVERHRNGRTEQVEAPEPAEADLTEAAQPGTEQVDDADVHRPAEPEPIEVEPRA
jgi:ABC-2 type transport system ATP-binding protein